MGRGIEGGDKVGCSSDADKIIAAVTGGARSATGGVAERATGGAARVGGDAWAGAVEVVLEVEVEAGAGAGAWTGGTAATGEGGSAG